MSGRRLVDLAKLVNASRNVAKQHLELRSKQLDAYGKTSTLARAAKSQTDRVTLTVQAAAALAKRLNEDVPKYAENFTQQKSAPKDQKEGRSRAGEESRPTNYSARDGAAGGELDVRQETAARSPLPDGTTPSRNMPIESRPQLTNQPLVSAISSVPQAARDSVEDMREHQRWAESQIPSVTAAASTPKSMDHDRDVYYERSKGENTAYSSLPRSKIPKHTEGHQDDGISRKEINADVFHNRPGQVDTLNVPKDVDINVFRTSKVSDMLGIREPGTTRSIRDRPEGPRIPDVGEIHPALRDSRDPSHVPAIDVGLTERASDATASKETEDEMRNLAEDMAKDAEQNAVSDSKVSTESISKTATMLLTTDQFQSDPVMSPQASPAMPFQMRESRVPSSRLGRLWQYAGLGTSMALGAVSEGLRRATGGGAGGSLMLSPANLERLVAKLSRMRGAALKLGQMISFQDLKLLPAPIHEVLQRVQDSADYMPASQRNRVLSSNLGSDWRELFSEFGEVPIAAASIGQVHRATLKSTGEEVAVKVQYPGVATSIDSDLNNLSILLTASRLLPKGLYLEKTIANARVELAWECDYIREAAMAERFRTILADEADTFTVPRIIPEASGREVLTAELMRGIGVTKPMLSLSQEERNWIGTQILRLCLREITEFKFMQTDPNWTNFLYNRATKKLELLDFGASRDYPDEFVDPYIGVLRAASKGDKATIRDLSIQLGYLTGEESKAMRDAHIHSVLTLAEPFSESAPEVYDFRDQTITDRVRALIPLMVRERLAPPPEETYSLHRKLSGAFLLSARLGAQVRCRDMFVNAVRLWEDRNGQAEL